MGCWISMFFASKNYRPVLISIRAKNEIKSQKLPFLAFLKIQIGLLCFSGLGWWLAEIYHVASRWVSTNGSRYYEGKSSHKLHFFSAGNIIETRPHTEAKFSLTITAVENVVFWVTEWFLKSFLLSLLT